MTPPDISGRQPDAHLEPGATRRQCHPFWFGRGCWSPA